MSRRKMKKKTQKNQLKLHQLKRKMTQKRLQTKANLLKRGLTMEQRRSRT